MTDLRIHHGSYIKNLRLVSPRSALLNALLDFMDILRLVTCSNDRTWKLKFFTRQDIPTLISAVSVVMIVWE